MREHDTMLLSRKPDQRKPHQRWRGNIEALGAILRQHTGQTLLARRFIQ